MEYFIGAILFVIVLIIIGLLLRKRIYDQVDRYEAWKLDVMNRNVAGELAKVKKLNLDGETKEKFEKWKNDWDHILTVQLSTVEELLYDTEQAADRYNFSKAKKHIAEMEDLLNKCEEQITIILSELDELLDLEQVNREEIEQIAPRVDELRKYLMQNRYIYIKAESRFELELDEIRQRLDAYYNLIEEGNYVQANELVVKMKQQLETLSVEFDEFPQLYKICNQELPNQLDELYKNIKDMKEEGYQVDHLNLENEINEYHAHLLDLVRSLEKDGTTEAKKAITDIEDRLEEMHVLLEKEALAKNYITSKLPSYERALGNIETMFIHTTEEVDTLKQTYYFEDDDIEQFRTLEKTVAHLHDQLRNFTLKVEENNVAHTKLREELEDQFVQLEQMSEEHEAFKVRMHNLRKDELEARAQLTKISDDIYRTNRKLRQSNLPGIPTFIWRSIEDAAERNERVLSALEEKPLDIIAVQKSLQAAQQAVTETVEKTNMMLEQAYLTERVIQYANRYRRGNPILAAALLEAEALFRKASYEEALEKAANAVEAVEPGALKKIEKISEIPT